MRDPINSTKFTVFLGSLGYGAWVGGARLACHSSAPCSRVKKLVAANHSRNLQPLDRTFMASLASCPLFESFSPYPFVSSRDCPVKTWQQNRPGPTTCHPLTWPHPARSCPPRAS